METAWNGTCSSSLVSKVFNLRGGLAGWRAENLPVSRDTKDKGKA